MGVDMIWIGDDVGDADRHADLARASGGGSSSRGWPSLIAAVKAINPQLKVAYHSDGDDLTPSFPS